MLKGQNGFGYLSVKRLTKMLNNSCWVVLRYISISFFQERCGPILFNNPQGKFIKTHCYTSTQNRDNSEVLWKLYKQRRWLRYLSLVAQCRLVWQRLQCDRRLSTNAIRFEGRWECELFGRWADGACVDVSVKALLTLLSNFSSFFTSWDLALHTLFIEDSLCCI